MKTVNIRQLKNNPSTALAAAREDDLVVVMNRDEPQAVLVDLQRLGAEDSLQRLVQALQLIAPLSTVTEGPR